jgi:hypothetical protein
MSVLSTCFSYTTKEYIKFQRREQFQLLKRYKQDSRLPFDDAGLFVCSFFTSIPLTLIMIRTGFLKDFLILAMLGESMSPQHGASTACRWKNGLQLWRVAANILNKQERTNDKGWSSILGVGHGANKPSP